MNKLLSQEALEEFKTFADEQMKLLKEFKPIVRAELASLNDFQFIGKVCRSSIGKIEGAKEGDFLLQCATYHNKLYFDKLNRNKDNVIKEADNQVDIEVNVVGFIKFSMACPRAGSNMCKLRDFTFETNNYKQKVKDF